MESQQTQVLSVKDWMITILIAALPLVGIVMLFVWAFNTGENPSKSNWAKATLIWTAIGFILVFLFWGTIAALFMADSIRNY